MPTVRHPRTRDDVPGTVPARVTVQGDTFAVDDGSVTMPTDAHVRALAAAYDLQVSDLQDTAGTCDVVKADGEVCGRELPCSYHSEGDD
jgi:hypothetical protein